MLGVLCGVVLVCVRALVCGWQVPRLSGVELYPIEWCMGLVDGYGCAEKTNPPVLCLSIWHIKN